MVFTLESSCCRREAHCFLYHASESVLTLRAALASSSEDWREDICHGLLISTPGEQDDTE